MNVEGVGAEKVFFPLADGLAAAPPDWQLARVRVAESKIGSISPSAYLPASFANDQRRFLIPFAPSWSACKPRTAGRYAAVRKIRTSPRRS